MSEQPFKWLDWRNRFTRHLIQPLVGVDCFQEDVPLNPENNIIILNLSEVQFLKIFSSLMTGAEISYPDESMQVVADFLKGIQCPPSIVAEECFTLPTYANNIKYTPVNPYIEPDTIPDGYLMQPFLVNGQNGNDFPGFEPFDVIVPIGAITLDVNFFEEIAGQLPTLEIVIQGQGSVNLHFLTAVQGGLVVVTLDNPPDLLDILAGIVTGSENIIDLNQDLVSLPPETAKDLIYPVTIETGGIHTIYAVFLPILDDSLLPIRFGGGFRGLELCGVLPEASMGIQNLRFLDCNLEQLNQNGDWVIVDGWENWLDCVPSGGSGGGTAAISGRTYFNQISNLNFTNTASFQEVTDSDVGFTFTKSKALIGVGGLVVNSGAGSVYTKPLIKQGSTRIEGVNLTENRMQGTTARTMWTWDFFEDIPLVNSMIMFDAKVSAGTGTLSSAADLHYVIIEYENAEDLFVQDVRIVGRELQKKIGGVWITVTDSLAVLLNSIEAIANNAAAAAAAAQSTANNALTVANGAVTVNNTQNNRLNIIEGDIEDLELDAAAQAITLADHEARIEVLEGAVGADSPYFGGGVWGQDYTWNDAHITGIAPFTLDDGILTSLGVASNLSPDPNIASVFSTAVRNNQVTHVGVKLIALGHTNPMSIKVTVSDIGGLGFSASFVQTSFVAGEHIFWMRVPNSTALFKVEAEGNNADRFYMRGLRVLGRGTSPF